MFGCNYLTLKKWSKIKSGISKDPQHMNANRFGTHSKHTEPKKQVIEAGMAVGDTNIKGTK